MFRHTSILALTLLVLTPAALAQDPAAMPPPPTPAAPPVPTLRGLSVDEAAHAREEAELVRKLRILDLKAQIADQERKIRGDGAGPAGADSVSVPIPAAVMRPGSVDSSAPMPAPMPMPAAQPARPSQAFLVASVWGVEGAYTAEILSGGMRFPVRRGDTLPSGWSVVEVLRTGVVISRGKERQTLMVGG